MDFSSSVLHGWEAEHSLSTLLLHPTAYTPFRRGCLWLVQPHAVSPRGRCGVGKVPFTLSSASKFFYLFFSPIECWNLPLRGVGFLQSLSSTGVCQSQHSLGFSNHIQEGWAGSLAPAGSADHTKICLLPTRYMGG